jgi:alpha-beta hydrolase superfamily lysophospholipase
MTSNQAVQVLAPARTRELTFAGDEVRLAGQIDYPAMPRPATGYPLIFVLHHAGCNTRECYNHYVDVALAAGYAVFRWDKRGTGRSGAGGRGSTTQDAVNAYSVALEQPDVDPRRAVILAQGAGTAMLGNSYGLFAQQQPPFGVILVSNMLDPDAILAIETRVQIVSGDGDWNSPDIYAEAACRAHNAAYRYGAAYFIAAHADRELFVEIAGYDTFHSGARKAIQDWLLSVQPVFPSI